MANAWGPSLAQNIADYVKLSTMMVAIDWLIRIAVAVGLFMVARSKARWREV